MSESAEKSSVLKLTASIVSAHVSRNPVPAGELPGLVASVYSALTGVGQEPEKPTQSRQEPAVPVKKSVQRDYIVCLEDGKKLKMLKRHLATSYNLTPDQYREKWSLPADYPMVAPAYSARRSALAKEAGLGTAGTARRKKRK